MNKEKRKSGPKKSLSSFLLTGTIPLLYLFNLFLIWRFQETIFFPGPILILGVILALMGTILWAISFWELLSVFQVLPVANKRIKKGVYRWLKHPMYVGIFLTFTGLSLTFQSQPGLIFALFLILPLLAIRATLEEKRLID